MAVNNAVFLKEFRENWRILLVAFVCLLVAFSAPAFALPFLFSSVIDEYGWTREQATFLASAKYFTGSIVAIVIGRFIDVIGVRNVLIGVTIIGGLALVSFLWVSNLTHYYLAGVMLGIASPGTIVAIKVLISRITGHRNGYRDAWYQRRGHHCAADHHAVDICLWLADGNCANELRCLAACASAADFLFDRQVI